MRRQGVDRAVAVAEGEADAVKKASARARQRSGGQRRGWEDWEGAAVFVRARPPRRRRRRLVAAPDAPGLCRCGCGRTVQSSRPARTAPKPHLCGRCFACVRERAVRISPALLSPSAARWGCRVGLAVCRLRARLGGQRGRSVEATTRPSRSPRRAAAEETAERAQFFVGSSGEFDHIVTVSRSRSPFPPLPFSVVASGPLRPRPGFLSGRWERGAVDYA